MISCLLSIIGWYLLARALYGAYRVIEEIYFIRELDLSSRYGKGSWAFVTGSTDGIGLEFAIQLAKRGFNIVMIARNRQKMNEKEELIKKANPLVQVQKVEIDFKDSGDSKNLENIINSVSNLDISIVINNVEVTPAPVLDMSMQTALDMVVVNCVPQTIFDRLLIPQLAKRDKRSAVVDVSSIASIFPLPGKEIYAGTKQYNRYLTNGLSMGVKAPIDFLSLKPAFVTTNLTGQRKEDKITCNTEECVLGALRALGHKTETYGANKHIVFGTIAQGVLLLLPIEFLMRFRDAIYGVIGYKAFTNAQTDK